MNFNDEKKELMLWYKEQYRIMQEKYKHLPPMARDIKQEDRELTKEFNKRMLELQEKYVEVLSV